MSKRKNLNPVINKRSDEVKNSLLYLSRSAPTFFGNRAFIFSSVEIVGEKRKRHASAGSINEHLFTTCSKSSLSLVSFGRAA